MLFKQPEFQTAIQIMLPPKSRRESYHSQMDVCGKDHYEEISQHPTQPSQRYCEPASLSTNKQSFFASRPYSRGPTQAIKMDWKPTYRTIDSRDLVKMERESRKAPIQKGLKLVTKGGGVKTVKLYNDSDLGIGRKDQRLPDNLVCLPSNFRMFSRTSIAMKNMF